MKYNIEFKNFHFIGIGGIGMSALARLIKSAGAEVSGSDSLESEITEALKKEGVPIFIGHDSKNLTQEKDCVIYTLAIDNDNPELVEARNRKLSIFTYAEMLGRVSSDLYTIAVSGTHGKTTTTAMIYSSLKPAGANPNMIVGSLLSCQVGSKKNDEKNIEEKIVNEFKTNFFAGESDLFVVEACEYKKSFLNLNPKILVITNIDSDHLDFYKNLEGVKSAFMEMADKVPGDGAIICDFDDANLSEIIKKHKNICINYRSFISQVPKLKVLGEHNIKNAACALAVCDFLNDRKMVSPSDERRGLHGLEADFSGSTFDLSAAARGLSEFRGTWRRLEFRGKNSSGALIYDDYGHHPTEISATLNALRANFSDKKIVVFFQPHLYSRTKLLFKEFVEVFNKAFSDKGRRAFALFILPIYAAREENDPEISSQKLADSIPGSVALSDFDSAQQESNKFGEESILLTLGAGDIYRMF